MGASVRTPRPGVGAPRLQRALALPQRPHVCFVAPQAWPVLSGQTDIAVVGGAEVQQSLLARLLAREGYPVSMICFDYGQPAQTRIDGIHVLRTHRLEDGLPGLRYVHPRMTAMWAAMRAANADIYYQRSSAVLTALVAAFCRQYGRRSLYAGASDSDFLPGRQLIRGRGDRWLFERGLASVDAVVVQNETQQRDCLRHYRRQSTLIPSCYELPANARPRPGDYALWVATLRPGKHPERFLELARRLPDRRFVMIGGADALASGGEAYFQRLRSAAAALPNVEFTGFLPLAAVEPWFDGARMVINTSSCEGMPNVFLQAWARGVPTLAFTDIGARFSGETVCPALPDLNAAVDAVNTLFSDDLHHARAAARCRAYFAATHECTAVLARYGSVFAGLMQGMRPC